MTTAQQGPPALLDVDSQGRISLGQMATCGRYLAHMGRDGTIVLTPALVLPAPHADRQVVQP